MIHMFLTFCTFHFFSTKQSLIGLLVKQQSSGVNKVNHNYRKTQYKFKRHLTWKQLWLKG